jgi:hypothetical protein
VFWTSTHPQACCEKCPAAAGTAGLVWQFTGTADNFLRCSCSVLSKYTSCSCAEFLLLQARQVGCTAGQLQLLCWPGQLLMSLTWADGVVDVHCSTANCVIVMLLTRLFNDAGGPGGQALRPSPSQANHYVAGTSSNRCQHYPANSAEPQQQTSQTTYRWAKSSRGSSHYNGAHTTT